MSCRFKPFNRAQRFLLPPSLHDWLPHGDLAYFIIERAEHNKRRKAASGPPPFHPKNDVGSPGTDLRVCV